MVAILWQPIGCVNLENLLAAGRLNPKYVDHALDEIAAAIELVATRSNLGRLVLRTASPRCLTGKA